MASVTDEHDFSYLIDATECQMLIKSCVTVLSSEHTALQQALLSPQPLDEETRKMFKLGKNSSFTTADLARARVHYYEQAQDRLWAWYKRLT